MFLVLRVQWLERATELIEKDDAARDSLGLPKPSYEELDEVRSLKRPQGVCDAILCSLGLDDIPPGGLKNEDR